MSPDSSNPVPALVFGGLLVLGGCALAVAHLRSWRRRRQEDLSESERRHYRRQFRRRIQVAGLMILIGVMLPVGDSAIPWPRLQSPAWWFAVYWLIVIALTLWVIVLALGDLLASRVHLKSALNELEARRRDLERQADRLRAQSGNGTHDRH